jgi:hypothetical protein
VGNVLDHDITESENPKAKLFRDAGTTFCNSNFL